jgi:hypothetical protein
MCEGVELNHVAEAKLQWIVITNSTIKLLVLYSSE